MADVAFTPFQPGPTPDYFDTFPGSDWYQEYTVGWAIHRGTVYMQGQVAGYGTPSSTQTILPADSIPVQFRPTVDTSIDLWPDIDGADDGLSPDAPDFDMGAYAATVGADGSLTLDSPLPANVADQTYYLPLVIASSWESAGGAVTDSGMTWQSLASLIHYDFDDVDAEYAVHDAVVHLRGSVKALTPVSQGWIASTLPTGIQPADVGGTGATVLPLDADAGKLTLFAGSRLVVLADSPGSDSPAVGDTDQLDSTNPLLWAHPAGVVIPAGVQLVGPPKTTEFYWNVDALFDAQRQATDTEFDQIGVDLAALVASFTTAPDWVSILCQAEFECEFSYSNHGSIAVDDFELGAELNPHIEMNGSGTDDGAYEWYSTDFDAHGWSVRPITVDRFGGTVKYKSWWSAWAQPPTAYYSRDRVDPALDRGFGSLLWRPGDVSTANFKAGGDYIRYGFRDLHFKVYGYRNTRNVSYAKDEIISLDGLSYAIQFTPSGRRYMVALV